MKVNELLKMVDEAVLKTNIHLLDVQKRIFESPHTSWEFNQRSLELQDELDKLKRIREFLEKYDPDEDAEKVFSEEELKELLEYLAYMREIDSYEP
ncbi:hypothetical protein PAP_04955 [Palaeococcus pacificus DY20341]|uniref:Uncharacterized protein n=1 Tax=Palaeococcus pacificus DY20341 TaxID=1343739 RepID=A0A075LTV3_9EURY|nr:hypothetical protein [Palaeococcus pacificus]AIF69402.1 hypothetical protein PAP_04955 [Palaeococcus pacificus DY20341]